MSNNPIDTNSFKHFLEIRGVKTEIAEPVNFNLSNFKVIQDDIARDTYLGNEETSLEFYTNDFSSQSNTYMDNNGLLINHLQSGANLIIQENTDYGNEADVKYILEKDNVSFTTGNLDFSEDYESDNLTYVKCRVIQNNNQALIKKREDVTVDLLSDKDLDDNTITTIPIQKLFLKAKPTYAVSKWENFNLENKIFNHFGQDSYYIPLSNSSLTDFTIDNSYVQFESYYSPSLSSNDEIRAVRSGARMIIAKEDLTNIKIKINDLNAVLNASSNVDCRLIIQYGLGYFSTESTIVELQSGLGGFSISNFNYELTIPSLPSGHHIIITFTSFVANFPTGAILGNVTIDANFKSIEITATSTAISSVTNAVRYIDLIKQTYKGIGSLPVNAEKYDINGEFYDNFCFNKNLIKQNTTSPFYVKLKDVKEQLLEQCSFAQVNDSEIYTGQYSDFYTNNDMGGFIESPDIEAKIYKNPKYLVNKYIFGYEKYEQDRGEKNTVDAIHTDSEWFVQADNSTNTKSFKLPFIRDPFITEVARRMVFSTTETSTNDDDNIFIADVVRLPPNARNKFTRLLSVSTSGGEFKLLSDNTFTWDKLGFNVGDTVIINNANGIVLNITPTILTINYSGSSGTGSQFITIDYPLTNVLYTNRTNEGLIFSENLRNSDNFGNLRYSIKRNMKYWYSVLATYGKFIPTKKIKNTYFKSNGYATTQFIGEALPIKENADINMSDISSYKILTQDLYKTIVRISWLDSVQLLKDIQNVRGFIRVQNPNGAIIKAFIKEANFIWTTEELSLILEIKNESDFLNLSYNAGILTINEVGYTEKTTNIKNYNIFNDFIQFFDNNSINLCNRTRFDKVAVNGITYDNIDNLVNAIENL